MKQVAIIIPFVAWNAIVREAVKACLALEYPAFQLVLLPDAAMKLPEAIDAARIILLPTGAQTIAAKRNMGIRAVAADIYAFLDSDAAPRADWIGKAVGVFERLPSVAAVGGPNLCPDDAGWRQKAVGNALKSFLVSGAGAFRKSRSASRYCADLPTCNLLVTKETFARVGLFNQALKTGEDMELCCRLVAASCPIYFDRDVVVYHHNRPLFFPFFFQRFTYGSTVFELLRARCVFSNLLLTLPFLFLLALLVGIVCGMWIPRVAVAVGAVLVAYVFLLAEEAMRHAGRPAEIPLTFVALLIGNLAPGIGTFVSLCGFRPDLKNIYRNDFVPPK